MMVYLKQKQKIAKAQKDQVWQYQKEKGIDIKALCLKTEMLLKFLTSVQIFQFFVGGKGVSVLYKENQKKCLMTLK